MEYEKLKRIISEQLNVPANSLTKSMSFVSDIGADSLALLELQIALCREFDIDISDEAMKNIKTIGDAYNCVMSLIV
ncbi:MAG: acyl carrier protein [Lachnospiraceae bacterium]|nr:acyl carrier protein [Lachnospiraceae bacterium]